MSKVNAIVLAGGKGSRLGRRKTLETVNSTPLLQRVVSRLAFLGSTIIIVTAGEDSSPQMAGANLRIVNDVYPGKGPLAGIHAGLKASDSFYNVVVASDMPFLNHALLRYMIDVSPGFDLVVPRVGDLVEPLHAVYSRDCIEPVEALLKEGALSALRLLKLVNVRYVGAGEVDRFDPEHLSFFNINTEADLKKARELAERMES